MTKEPSLRAFIDGLASEARPYWDMVEIGDQLSRDLHLSAELVILYSDGVEDFNPWYEGWRMNSWHIEGESPFGGAIVPPLLVSHFVLSVQFDATRPFSIGSIHTYHDSEILEPIPVGATVRITTRATEKFEKRGRHKQLSSHGEKLVTYARHMLAITDAGMCGWLISS